MKKPLEGRIKIATRPGDWAPAARAHLFGLETLTPVEFASEGQRMSAGRPTYGDEVFLRARRLAQMQQRAH